VIFSVKMYQNTSCGRAPSRYKAEGPPGRERRGRGGSGERKEGNREGMEKEGEGEGREWERSEGDGRTGWLISHLCWGEG